MLPNLRASATMPRTLVIPKISYGSYIFESNAEEEVRVTRKAKSAQPRVTNIALSETFNERDLNEEPTSHVQF